LIDAHILDFRFGNVAL